MPDDRDRHEAERAAQRTADYFAGLLARGFSRREACDLTVAYVLGRVAQPAEPDRVDEREEWQKRE